MAEYDMNNLTTLAKRLRPLIQSAAAETIKTSVAEGPGIDLVISGAQTRVGIGGDTVLIYHADGSPANEYSTLTAAIAAATSGDVVLLPPQTFADDITIPAGVTLVGAHRATKLSGTIESASSGIGAVVGCEIQTMMIINAGDLHTYACKLTADYAYKTGGGGTYRSHGDEFSGVGQPASYDYSMGFASDEDGWTEAPNGYTQVVHAPCYNSENYVMEWINTQGHLANGCLHCHGPYNAGPLDQDAEFLWYYRPSGWIAAEGYQLAAWFKETVTSSDYWPIGKPFVRIWYTDNTYDETLYTPATYNFDWHQVAVGVSSGNTGKTIQEFQIGFLMDGTGPWQSFVRDGYIDDATIGSLSSPFEAIGSTWDEQFANHVPLWSDRAAQNAADYPERHTDDIDTSGGIHHTLGTGANQAAAGNHTHAQLHDAVTVSDSASIDLTLSGQALSAAVIPGGIKLDDFGTPDDNTDLDASTSRHGLLKKLSNVANEVMSGTGSWISRFFAFTQLTDAPSAYTGLGGKYLRVKATEDGLEAATVSGGSGSIAVQEIDGTPSVSDVTTIKVTNGTLTDDGSGTVTLDFGSAATDGSAIHDNVANEISAITEKTSLAAGDVFLIESPADGGAKRMVKAENIFLPDTYGRVLIADVTLSADGAFSVSGIPSDIDHLEYDLVVKPSATTTRDVLIAFNGDTTNANYLSIQHYGGDAHNVQVQTSYRGAGWIPYYATAGVWAMIHGRISFAQMSIHKILETYTVVRSGASLGLMVHRMTHWSNTAAVTQIDITASADQLKAGSRLMLYGLKSLG
jgi:hypothetical protein